MSSKTHLAVLSAVIVGLTVPLAGCGGSGGGGGGVEASSNTVPPVFSSPPQVSVYSGATGTVYTAAAIDSAGGTVTYSLSGTDASKFTINSATGGVSFLSPPNYSSPSNANADNNYQIAITATDGAGSAVLDVSVLVTYQTTNASYTFTNAPWGGGGFISGLIYHPKTPNLLYARTDVGGAYRWNPSSLTWTPLNDDLGRNDSQLTGVLSLALDPNDPSKVYLATGQYIASWARTAAILRSSDQGATWTRTELPIDLGGNSDGRNTGERFAVDPNDGAILFLGTSQNGVYTSSDSGVTWAQLPSFNSSASTTFVLFDPSTGTLGTPTHTIYVGVNTTSGTALYASMNGGTSWSAVPNQPTGFIAMRGVLDGKGNLYVTYCNALGPNGITSGAVYKLNVASNIWTNISPVIPGAASNDTFGYDGVSVDRQNPNTLIVSSLDRRNYGDSIWRSTDGGATWTSLKTNSSFAASNNPWLTAYAGGKLGMPFWISDVEIDPFNSANAVFNTGFGLYATSSLTSSSVSWSFNDAGIEETVQTNVTSGLSGAHLLMTQGDVGGGRYTTLSASDNEGFFTNPNATNSFVDEAIQNPNYVVRTAASAATQGYISADNGVTWSGLGSSPVTSGNDPSHLIFSANASTLLWAPNNQGAYYSADKGTIWAASTGYPTYSGQYFPPAADKAVDGIFYTYDFTAGIIYQSSDGGKTFASVLTGLPTWNGGQVVSLPWKQRDLWIPTGIGLYHVDGVNGTATKISAVSAAYLLSYGAPAPGQSYPSLYLWGNISGTDGVYRSDDEGVTWTRINDALHQYGYINAMSGDPRVYGRVYLGTGGRGTIVGNR